MDQFTPSPAATPTAAELSSSLHDDLPSGTAAEPTPPSTQQPACKPDDPFKFDQRGTLWMQSGDLAAAEASFRNAIAADPNIAGFHLNLGRCLARSHRVDDAAIAIQLAVTLAPDDPEPHSLLGDIMLHAGRPADAEAAFRRSLALRDNEIDVLHRLGIAIEHQGRYAEAIATAERVAALEPTSADYQARIGTLCTLAGDTTGMERAYRSAIALRPANLAFHQALINALDRQGRDKELLQAMQGAMAVGPHDAGLADQFGSLMMARERWAYAEDAFRKVASMRPDNFSIFHKLGIVLERQGKTNEAIEAAERASTLAPVNDSLIFRLATMTMHARRFPAAEQAVRRLMRLRPPAVQLHHMLAVALERQGRFAEALEEALEARTIEPDDRGLQGHVVSLAAKCSRGRPLAPKTYLIFAAAPICLGQLMTAVLNAAFYAWETGRVLCMDMRRFRYFGDDAHDAFFEHFQLLVPDALEVVADLAAIDELSREPDLYHVGPATLLDIERPFPNKVLMVPCIAPGDPFGPRERQPEQPFRIELKGKLAQALSVALARPEWQRHVIGLHFRAGAADGGEARISRDNVPDFDERYAAVKDRLAGQAMRLVTAHDPGGCAIFVASDDRAFVEEMTARLPNAFGSPRVQQDAGRDPAGGPEEMSILTDAVTDLWSLSQCHQLIHSGGGLSHFAILNSPYLDDSNTFYIHMPTFDEILDSLPPDGAVEWARAAVRKVDLGRRLSETMHRSLARTLLRRGLDEEAALCTKRANWLFQAAHVPTTSNRQRLDQPVLANDANAGRALERARRAIVSMPDNPYFHAGYSASLSMLLLHQNEPNAAVAAARDAVALDPLDPFLHDHLGGLLAMAGDAAAAEASFCGAVDLAPDVASFHVNLSACAARRGDLPAALTAASRAAELDPGQLEYRARCEALELIQRITMLTD